MLLPLCGTFTASHHDADAVTSQVPQQHQETKQPGCTMYWNAGKSSDPHPAVINGTHEQLLCQHDRVHPVFATSNQQKNRLPAISK
jgi:hypothetical protein